MAGDADGTETSPGGIIQSDRGTLHNWAHVVVRRRWLRTEFSNQVEPRHCRGAARATRATVEVFKSAELCNLRRLEKRIFAGLFAWFGKGKRIRKPLLYPFELSRQTTHLQPLNLGGKPHQNSSCNPFVSPEAVQRENGHASTERTGKTTL